MKLWIDDIRPAPEGYIWCKSVKSAKKEIEKAEKEQEQFYNRACREFQNGNKDAYYLLLKFCNRRSIDLIDIDHDAGKYASKGGDYIKLLDWLEETGRNYPIRIHSQNPVGVENMRRIIQRNGWKEIR